MFFISKSVADGIKSLREREDVRRELDAIRAVPGYEVYANAIAEGVAGEPQPAARPGTQRPAGERK